MNGIPKLDDAALDLALRPVVDDDEFRVRHRSVLRARPGVRADPERRSAGRRDAGHVAALQPERPHLPLRAPEPRPLGAGAEDPRGLGARAAIPRASRASPTTPASAATTMQYQVQLDPQRAARRYGVTVPQIVDQLAANNAERRRRLLLAGRPVLLRARPRPGRSRSRTSATSSSRRTTAFPVYVKDVAHGRDRPRRRAWGSSATCARTMPSRASS